jgi:hypothetical protein
VRRIPFALVLSAFLLLQGLAGPAAAAAGGKRISVTPMSSGCGTSGYTLQVTIRQRVTNSFIGSARFHESVYRCWNGSTFTSGPSWVDRSFSNVTGIFTGISRQDNSHDLLFNFYDRSMETDWSFGGTWCSHKVYQEIWLANDDGSAAAKWHGDDCVQEYLTITSV